METEYFIGNLQHTLSKWKTETFNLVVEGDSFNVKKTIFSQPEKCLDFGVHYICIKRDSMARLLRIYK
jgi:hypothetical protein